MKFGVVMFPTDYSISPVELGQAAEQLGYESLWFPEHTHIPASRRSPWPGGGELPQEYWHTIDPFIALAAVAAVTKRLRLGFAVCLVVERDPIVTAKQVASLDHVSGGRVEFGVGFGWNREEMENHGTPWARRFLVGRERVEAMKAIWTQDEAGYQGETVRFERIWAWPKPVQKPHPPVLVAGSGTRTLDRVVRYGDGWIPIQGRLDRPLEEWIAELRRKLEAGRTRSRPTDHDLRRPGGRGGAGAVDRSRRPPRAPQSPAPDPRRDPAPARTVGRGRRALLALSQTRPPAARERFVSGSSPSEFSSDWIRPRRSASRHRASSRRRAV